MAERVVLHVGTMKSGTSYLQALLFAEKPRLAEAGVLVPGAVWADQARAVRQALAPRQGGSRPRWTAFVDEVRAASGTAVISMEYLGPSNPRTIATVLEALGAQDVRVVVTARDLNRTLVSMWQETIQNGRTWTWAEYVADAEAKRPRAGAGAADRRTPGGTFWRQQDLVRMVADWTGVVGDDNVVLATVPPPGAAPTVLAERFAEASGVDLDTGRDVTTANESLGSGLAAGAAPGQRAARRARPGVPGRSGSAQADPRQDDPGRPPRRGAGAGPAHACRGCASRPNARSRPCARAAPGWWATGPTWIPSTSPGSSRTTYR